MSILVVGSVALDTIKTPFAVGKDVLGGSATYFSVSAGFFSPVDLVAVVGSDFPPKYADFLKKRNVDLKGLECQKGKTFRWTGEYNWDFTNPRTIATHLNVFSSFNPAIPEDYREDRYVFLANIDPELQIKVLKKVRKPELVACDTMNYWIENKPKALIRLIKMVDIFFLNEAEAREFTGEANLVKAARHILRFGPKRLIIKKGEHGSMLFSKNSVFSVPAYLLESVFDPTGAGDSFAGGVIGYLASQKKSDEATLRKAVVAGTVMATFAVEDFSLRRLGSITKSDIAKRLKQFERLTHF